MPLKPRRSNRPLAMEERMVQIIEGLERDLHGDAEASCHFDLTEAVEGKPATDEQPAIAGQPAILNVTWPYVTARDDHFDINSTKLLTNALENMGIATAFSRPETEGANEPYALRFSLPVTADTVKDLLNARHAIWNQVNHDISVTEGLHVANEFVRQVRANLETGDFAGSRILSQMNDSNNRLWEKTHGERPAEAIQHAI